MKIWIAVIEHRHGQNVYAAKTKQKLLDQLYDYVKRWWESEMPDEELPPSVRNDSPPHNLQLSSVHQPGSDLLFRRFLRSLPL